MIEKVRLTLDKGGRLQSYRLCLPGRGISDNDESPLTEIFRGQTAEEILSVSVGRFCEGYPAEDDWPQVIFMRQFLGLRAVMGWLASGSNNGDGYYNLELETNEDGSKVVEGEINFGYAIAKIAACRQCQGCGKSRKTLKRNK